VNPSPAGPPAIQIVRGDPDPYELAALTVVLVTALADDALEAGGRPARVPSPWTAPRLSAPARSWAARTHPSWRPVF
jgi:hypothetical protein